MKASPRFNGRVFVNTHLVSAGFKEGVERPTLRDFLCGGERRIPPGPIPLVNPLDVWARPPQSGLRVTWLGHSSLLIEIEGARFLTDPVWAARASPLPFAGPKRFHPPPVALDALPPLDAVLLSHDHYDHLDRSTIRSLARRPVPFVTSLGVGAHLERWGIGSARITELDWWEHVEVHGVTITAAPAQHFSGRGLKDRNTTLWSSLHLRGSGAGRSFFFGADSGLTSEYEDIARRLGPFDMVAIEIGAYHPAWGDIHMGPDNALRAYAMLGSGVLLPVHWGTFNLAMHPWDDPIETVFTRAPAAGIPLATPRIGQPVEPAMWEGRDPWWRGLESGRQVRIARARPADGSSPVEWAPD